MADKLLSFGAFSEFSKILEESKNRIEGDIINEAFASDYLRKFASQESGSRWQSGLAKDFYKFAKIPLDKVTNEDFIILSNPAEWWTQRYAKNDNAIGFFVDDNPEFLKELKRKKKAKGSAGIGVILTIMRGNRGMWYGFAKDPGQSFSRYKKSPSERYGVLADEYDTASLYGWDGAKQKAKITRPNLEEMATKVYVLDIDALREKYGSTAEIRDKRAKAKSGAIAMKDNSVIKKEQVARYRDILQKRLDPDSMLKDLQSSISKYSDWMNKKIATMKFNPDDAYEQDFYRKQQVQWQGWSSDLGRPLSNMMDVLDKFMREWNEYLRDQEHVSRLNAEMDKETDSVKISKLQGEINYYEKSYKRFVQKVIGYRETLMKYSKDVDKIVAQ